MNQDCPQSLYSRKFVIVCAVVGCWKPPTGAVKHLVSEGRLAAGLWSFQRRTLPAKVWRAHLVTPAGENKEQRREERLRGSVWGWPKSLASSSIQHITEVLLITDANDEVLALPSSPPAPPLLSSFPTLPPVPSHYCNNLVTHTHCDSCTFCCACLSGLHSLNCGFFICMLVGVALFHYSVLRHSGCSSQRAGC